MKKQKSLKGKMILFTVSLLLATILISMSVSIYMSRKGLLDNVTKDITSMGKIVNQDISARLEREAIKVQSLARTDTLEREDLTIKEKFDLLSAEKGQFQLVNIALVTNENQLLSESSNLTMDAIDSKWIDTARKNGISYSEPIINKDGSTTVLICASGADNNVVISILDGGFYSLIVKDFKIGETGNVFILDKTGSMIGTMRPGLVEKQANFITYAKTDSAYKSAATVYHKMIDGKTGIANYSYQGVERICYFSPIAGTDGWSFGVVVPINEMISSINMIVIAVVVISIILLIAGIILAIRFAINMIQPISKMQVRMELLAAGDIHSPLDIKTSNDEIGHMADSMKQTIEQLNLYIGDLKQGLQKVADGNLNVQLEVTYLGDFINLEQALTATVTRLNTTMLQITQSSDQVATGAEQVSSSSQALAQGATEQASSVQELTATVTEITGHIQENAQNAVVANDTAHKVGTELVKSNTHMEHMLLAMNEINQTSEEIGKIIRAIDDIAFQTNILALNAAVEAARAGEAGKGFAVVADEVRNLASKSASAAKDTTVLIESSIGAVKNGSKIANDTAKSLKIVVKDAQEIVTMMDRISTVSQKQAGDIADISSGLDQISSVVQTNSATSEESAAASEELSSQAQLMKEMMQQFVLAERADSYLNKAESVVHNDEELRQTNDDSKY